MSNEGADTVAAILRLARRGVPPSEQLALLPAEVEQVRREREQERRLREIEERMNLLNEQESEDYIPDSG
jgi:hypothetical protein